MNMKYPLFQECCPFVEESFFKIWLGKSLYTLADVLVPCFQPLQYIPYYEGCHVFIGAENCIVCPLS
jgi:hypothetical protein